jgi:hypothetical protein
LGMKRLGARTTGKPEAFGKCEREGFVARSHGASRESNPYNTASHPDQESLVLDKSQALLARAWWKGWDAANDQLA